jgi:hypothetical protein
MGRMVVLFRLGVVFSLLLEGQALVSHDLDLQVFDPAAKERVAVLRYRGEDLAKALAAGNKMKDTRKLNALIKVDKDDPRYGVIQWRGYKHKWEVGNEVGESEVYFPAVPLRLKRKDKDATDWELTEEATRAVRKKVR